MAAVGDTIPDIEAKVLDADGNPQSVRTGELLGTGRVVLFAVPGAFTPGCSKVHLPGFVAGRDELAAKGVDKVVCTSVNDAWVMDAWGRSAGADDIVMLADGNGDLAEALASPSTPPATASASAPCATPPSSRTASSRPWRSTPARSKPRPARQSWRFSNPPLPRAASLLIHPADSPQIR